MDRTTESRWNSYTAQRSPEMRRELAGSYVNLVRYVVGKLGVPDSAQAVLREDDLVQFGMIGLMTAIDRFDPDRGVRFETYAIPRIKGTILDELRKLDPQSRAQRRAEREQRGGVQGGSAKSALWNLVMENDRVPVRDVENLVEDDAPGPEEQLMHDEQTRTLVAALGKLAERDRLVVTLHYYEGLSQKDIAAVLNVSESRVSQIHTSVVVRLRHAMGLAGFATPVHRS